MKEKILKPLSVLLCAVLIGGITVYAMTSGEKKKPIQPFEQTEPVSGQSEDIVKDESVYVIAGADGSVKKIIVSDWIKNTLKSGAVTDKSELENVENLKGDESYTMNGDNMRVWDAKGGDIYCQGTVQKELPVGISVSYKLDGESISPGELAGKSGRVTIRFDYRNNRRETVRIDGKREEICVPFAMLTGVLLDNDRFRNIEVSNGKLINDGDRTAVIGLALPGLQENLKLDREKIKLPDWVEITADVEGFEMMNTATIATNELFNSIDTDGLNSIDDLTDAVDQLNDAVKQLTDGSSKLYGGLCVLLDKSDELVKGINELAGGAKQLKAGAKRLDKGANELKGGAEQLSDGLGALTANNKQLKDGSKQVFGSLLAMADEKLSESGLKVKKLTVKNYPEILNSVIVSLDKTNAAKKAQEAALKAVTDAVNAQKDEITAGVTAAVKQEVSEQASAAVRANVQSQVLSAMDMTDEQYSAGVEAGAISAEQQKQVTESVDAQMQSETVKKAIAANTETVMKSAETQAVVKSKTDEQIRQLIQQNMNSAEVQSQITEALEKAKSGAAQISALKQQLDSYNTFYNGLSEYTEGVSAAKKGADQLKSGAAELKSGTGGIAKGIDDLYGGILTMKRGAPTLVKGVRKLRGGAMQLSDGLKKFDKQGVKKLTKAVNGDLVGLLNRIKATVDVSKKYKAFAGISDKADGQVRFIYRTDEIKAE